MTAKSLIVSVVTVANLSHAFTGDLSSTAAEQPITHAPYNHLLTNTAVWSPSAQWLVYDVRSAHGFDGSRIERVNVRTGAVEVLYTSENGAHCGVVTYNPVREEVIFIHGPEHPAADWDYAFSRRSGVIVQTAQPGVARPLEAANYAPPFQPGALRGGTHVHVFSADGANVSFTYDDEVLTRNPAATTQATSTSPHNGTGLATAAQPNQRNVGVAVPQGPVNVNRNHPRNNDGDYFAFLATRTTASPQPGSDAISKACEEGWVGANGYRKSDGSWQKLALAFQGTVTAADGSEHIEVYIVDLPDDVTRPGAEPLEGTATTRPAPPAGTLQRRLTFTDSRPYPGLQGPRHWLRTSPDGSQIAFLMKDAQGVVQLWTVSPNGGEPVQRTTAPHSIASAFSWSRDGRLIAYVADNSVCVTEIPTGNTYRLTRRSAQPPAAEACVISPDGQHIAYMRPDASGHQQIFTVAIPAQLRTAEQ